MIFLILLACAVLAYRFWVRLSAIESTIVALTERLSAFEQGRAPSVAPPMALPTPQASRPAPPAPTPRTSAVGPTRSAAPHPAPAVPTFAASTTESPGKSRNDSLENRIGSRWLLYIGVVAIVIGASYFEKLAIDNHWMGETARVLQGALVGLVLVGIGLRFVRRGYQLYGRVLAGCGIAILYVSTYAAFNLYDLVGQPVAFTLMFMITTLAAWLADRERSQSLALVAAVGGFATPFLIPSADAHIGLFVYETILIAGIMFLARRREWPALNIVTYAFTVLTCGDWAERFYDASMYLSVELFLTLFCAMFLYILHESGHWKHPTAPAGRAILSTAPFLYYFASLVILAGHSRALLVFLILLSVVGSFLRSSMAAKMRLVFWIAVAGPLILWSDAHAGRMWLASGISAWLAAYLINLLGVLQAMSREESRFDATDIALLHLNGLAAYFGTYILLDPVHATATAPLAAAFALWHGILAAGLFNRHREPALHFVALTFTLLTIAVALQLEGVWITSAWSAEGAALIWLALRERREWLRAAGLLLMTIAAGRLVALQFSAPAPGQLLLLNGRAACGVFIIALTYLLALAHHRLAVAARMKLESGICLVAAKVLLLCLALSEIVAYWKLHASVPFEPVAQVVDVCLVIGAVTMALGLERRQEWIRSVGGGMVALGGLLLLSAQFEAAPVGYVTLLNGRAAAGVFTVIMLYGLAALHHRRGQHLPDLPVNLAVLTTAASLFTLSLLTSEIDAFWAARGAGDALSTAREGLQAIAWAVVGSFLIWRGLSNRRPWMRAIGAAVLATAVVRLLRVQAADPSSSYIVVLNARVMAAIVIIALMSGLARLYRNASDAVEACHSPRTILLVAANIVALTVFTSEITAYWHVHDMRNAPAFTSADSHFAREMMLSVTWATYAMLLIVAGLRKRYAPIRYLAMTVFVITIVKVFAIDLAELDRIYRILSVIGLGVALLMSSYLYQQLRAVDDKS